MRGALIAALYALLTLAVQPLSSGLMQVRVSEALCVLPYFTFSAVPGLLIGCIIANLAVGGIFLDVVFGSLATFVAALMTYFLGKYGKNRNLAPLPAVLVNAVVIGAVLRYGYEVPAPLYLCMLSVGAGQAISCYALGLPLMLLLGRHASKLFR